MTLVADSGAIYALYDQDDAHHSRVRSVIETELGAIILPVTVLGELDYLLSESLGFDAELAFLDDIVRGAYSLESFYPEDLKCSREIISSYRDLNPGLVDASVVAIAQRLKLDRILTVDERDFRVLRQANGKPFTLLPSDAS